MSKDFNEQFKSLQAELHASSKRDGAYDRMWKRVSTAIEDTDNVVSPATTLDYLQWLFFESISTPITIGAAMLVIVFGGFMTTVNAAQSLPGEALYSVKLATEKAQLKLSSLEHKAVLHTEFAGRRLEEASALNVSTDPAKTAQIKRTLDAYRSEVTQAGEDVRSLLNEKSTETMQVASAVDRKISVLNAEIDTRVQESDTNTLDIEDAKKATQAVSSSVVNVMMEEHETTSSNKLSDDIEKSFNTKLSDVQKKQSMVLGRLARIDEVVTVNKDLHIGGIVELRFAANETSVLMRSASDFAIAGGYRAAFDDLKVVDERLSEIANRIVAMEIVTTEFFANQKIEKLAEPVETEGQINSLRSDSTATSTISQ
ncbi:hypothetical protein CO173_04730 [Candidatus Uhrbacteria bacterium CG_4_9_14_3_um_filter_41_35]|uniref:DUF5667 domain-containing protein n=1 Tax=Candidatus Uhrbacteria bacterium CG_4_9_14_3_um_filter_41_35 TaxID=1975034 RepID=A0A2M7XCW8_9BACT|nr:MAG: hypothetical protein CO173_04730 [Candidatus Uhrbacteria bacterium CG_4_9_14_3_um_filter_41_35]